MAVGLSSIVILRVSRLLTIHRLFDLVLLHYTGNGRFWQVLPNRDRGALFVLYEEGGIIGYLSLGAGTTMEGKRMPVMRPDGREWDHVRPVRMTPGFVDYPEGSVLIELGNTRVLCNATIEGTVPQWRLGSGGGWVTAEYAMLPRSTHQRTRRETRGLRGRTQEIRRLVGRCLRAVLDLDGLGQRTIILDCDVIQADGGTRTAAITGAYVALALALKRLEEGGDVRPGLLLTEVAAISLGLVEGRLLLDLCYEEDAAATADFNIAMTGDGRFVEVQGTAEGEPFGRQRMEEVLDLAGKGIGQLLALQRRVLGM
jgi:ribonuclease PH